MRTYAITGGATGIGAELKRQLLAEGNKVISVDIKEGDIIADLSTAEGRQWHGFFIRAMEARKLAQQ